MTQQWVWVRITYDSAMGVGENLQVLGQWSMKFVRLHYQAYAKFLEGFNYYGIYRMPNNYKFELDA